MPLFSRPAFFSLRWDCLWPVATLSSRAGSSCTGVGFHGMVPIFIDFRVGLSSRSSFVAGCHRHPSGVEAVTHVSVVRHFNGIRSTAL